jgi:drug/metabolite transporter (DMT)-like permease
VLFVLLWSTGFIVARYATRDAGPLTFIAIRLFVAALLLVVMAWLTHAPKPDRTQSKWLVISAFGMHTMYLCGVFVSIDLGMPSGVSALIAGLHPVATSLLAHRLLREHLRRMQWVGVVMGFIGVVLVVIDRLAAKSTGITGWTLLAAAASVVGMSGGTLVQRRFSQDAPLLWGSVVQYSSSALTVLVGAIMIEHFEIDFTAQTLFSLAWAVIVLSLAAVLVMLWLLQRRAAANVSSLFFLTPALSTIEGAILFGERLGALAILGLVGGLAGVALVTRALGD